MRIPPTVLSAVIAASSILSHTRTTASEVIEHSELSKVSPHNAGVVSTVQEGDSTKTLRRLKGGGKNKKKHRKKKSWGKSKKSGGKSKTSPKGGKSKSEDYPTVITIGNKRAEGITEGPGSTMYVTQTAFGGVVSVDVKTGHVKQVIGPTAPLQRAHIGLAYTDGYVFVAGGGSFVGVEAKMYVYNVKSGADVAICNPGYDNAFAINDVFVSGKKAYFTDAGAPKLIVLDLLKALKGECEVTYIDLPSDFSGEGFQANGIVGYHDGLLVGNGGKGLVSYIDLKNNNAVEKIIPDGEVLGADGLVMRDDTLYITQNALNQISVWSLSGGRNSKPVSAVKRGEMTSPLYDFPSTSAIFGDYIYSPNFRVGSLPFPAENELSPDYDGEFHVIAVRNVFGSSCAE